MFGIPANSSKLDVSNAKNHPIYGEEYSANHVDKLKYEQISPLIPPNDQVRHKPRHEMSNENDKRNWISSIDKL